MVTVLCKQGLALVGIAFGLGKWLHLCEMEKKNMVNCGSSFYELYFYYECIPTTREL